jgi:hypothetical protein
MVGVNLRRPCMRRACVDRTSSTSKRRQLLRRRQTTSNVRCKPASQRRQISGLCMYMHEHERRWRRRSMRARESAHTTHMAHDQRHDWGTAPLHNHCTAHGQPPPAPSPNPSPCTHAHTHASSPTRTRACTYPHASHAQPCPMHAMQQQVHKNIPGTSARACGVHNSTRACMIAAGKYSFQSPGPCGADCTCFGG